MDKGILIKKIFLYCLGMAIIPIGVALSLVTNVGSDCFTVFTQGVSVALNMTTGEANRAILIVCIFIVLLVSRKYIKIGTFICLVGFGPLIDLSVRLCSMLPVADANIIVKCLIVILANVIVAVGFSILSATNLGIGPSDAIPFIITDKLKCQYKWVRITCDFLYLIVGFILGGTVGIGTVISAVILGQIVQFCLPYADRFVNGVNKLEDNIEIIEEIKQVA